MSAYPGYPDNRLIVNGVDITTTYQLILVDGYTLEPPSPKTYTVDIPGGNGVIDLTEALTGDTAYDNRSQSFDLYCIYPEDFEKVKTKVSNFLHGRSFDYKITMDPDYTYHGRFTVSSYTHSAYANGIVGVIQIDIDANPYKKKESCSYKLNATGGKMYRFESGRRKVHPVIECENVCFVTWNGVESTIPAGTYRLNDVLFSEGFNELYVNSCRLYTETWSDVSETGTDAMTWDSAKTYRWYDLQRLGTGYSNVPQSWDDLQARWTDYAKGAENEKQWRELDYRRDSANETSSTVYLTYDWEDL